MIKRNIICSTILVLLLAAVMYISLCTGFIVNAEERIENTGEQKEAEEQETSEIGEPENLEKDGAWDLEMEKLDYEEYNTEAMGDVASGKLGELDWTLDENGILTIF